LAASDHLRGFRVLVVPLCPGTPQKRCALFPLV